MMPILHIVNHALSSGIFPDHFKHACIRPLLKSSTGDKDAMKNYRPISNLLFLSKVIEKRVHNQIMPYLMSNDLFGVFQFAYRPYHSCETALFAIHNDIETMPDLKLNVVLLIYDDQLLLILLIISSYSRNCILITVFVITFWHGLTHICQVEIIM